MKTYFMLCKGSSAVEHPTEQQFNTLDDAFEHLTKDTEFVGEYRLLENGLSEWVADYDGNKQKVAVAEED